MFIGIRALTEFDESKTKRKKMKEKKTKQKTHKTHRIKEQEHESSAIGKLSPKTFEPIHIIQYTV